MNTSQNSAISGSIPPNDDRSNDREIKSVLNAWLKGLTPDPILSVSQWADRHRMLSEVASAEPGRWRTDRTPYLRELMDCLSAGHPAHKVVFMKGAQVGGTEAGNNWIGYIVAHVPGPMLVVLPTVEMGKRWSKGRLAPLIESTPELKEKGAVPDN